MASGWKVLRDASSDSSHPTLLVKYEFGSSNYKILLTDLTRIWIEELKQRPLIQRAWDIDSEIDPVDSDQRQVLLRHIQDSLDGKSGTKLALSKDQGPRGILLTAYSPLPKPLKPLRWPIHFTASSQSSLTNELLLPLLAEHSIARDQIISLLSSLNDKDHVISKLTDKMQAEGIELGKVFPSAVSAKSGRKAGSREDLGNSVQGLGAFNEHQWRAQSIDGRQMPGSCRELLLKLLAQRSGLASTGIIEQVEHGEWWELVGDEPDLEVNERKDSPHAHTNKAVKKEISAITTPLFHGTPPKEHQSWPEQVTLPQRGGNPQDSSPKTLDGGSTTDTSDDDLDAMQPKPRGERRESLKPLKPSGSSSDSSSPEPARTTTLNASPKPKPLLGRIGGASKADVSPSKPKLGQVGGTGKPIKTPSEAPTEDSVQLPKPRESSPERANRKREELKRELEEKGKVGVKKKRKF